MSRTVEPIPQLADRRPGEGRAAIESSVPAGVGVALCLLLAVAQVAIAGYRLGVGNQAIQIAFLKHWADPALFTNDEMVKQTLPLYPSYFFRLLAPLLKLFPLDALYFTLHVLTTFFTFVTTYFLGRSIFRSHASALAAVALLVAGHHHALAGDTLYSAGFTHTYVALPLALAALGLAYRRHMVWAFVVAGILFNLHALTGAYTLLMLIAALLADFSETPLRTWLARTAACAAVSIAISSPHPPPDAPQPAKPSTPCPGSSLMRALRSADHSFPATYGGGTPATPTCRKLRLLLFALFALSWGVLPRPPPRRRPPAPGRLTILYVLRRRHRSSSILGFHVFTEASSPSHSSSACNPSAPPAS